MRQVHRPSFFVRNKMPIEELVKYYAEQRKRSYAKGEKMSGVSLRKITYPLVRLILKIDQLTSKERIVVLKDLHTKDSHKLTIFACTHIGGNDIQRAFQTIDEPAYLMLGDPGILYRMPIYWGLKLNGVIPLETSDREDRKIAYARAVELLNSNGNLLIYPEGAWNVSPNLVVMKTFTGTVRMAQETNSEIVPIAMEQYGNTFYLNIGRNYQISKNCTKSVDELNQELRSVLATLKWEIIEWQEPIRRNNIPDNFLEIFQAGIVERCNFGYGFSLEDALKEAFHDKNITTHYEAFAHLNTIRPTMQTAFLFNKTLRG